MPKTLEKPSTGELKSAPMPAMASFIKLREGDLVCGTMKEVEIKVEQQKKRGGKTEERERYYFRIALARDTEVAVGPKKALKNQMFKAGELVTLPDHGFLVSALGRTAFELDGKVFNGEETPPWKKLEGVYFEILCMPSKKITKGDYKGTDSYIYDVKYRV
jgi:hypothetical protein